MLLISNTSHFASADGVAATSTPSSQVSQHSQQSPQEQTNEPEPRTQVQVLLCGCGNAVHTLIPFLAQQNKDHGYEFIVHVLSTHASDLSASLPEDKRIECLTDAGGHVWGKANLISDDPAALDIPHCRVILFALPTNRHELYLNKMKPFIQPHTMIGSMPGEGGFDLCVRNVLGDDLTDKCVLFSLETLPWACRIEVFGQRVQILGTKKDIDLCVVPGDAYVSVQPLLQAMIGPLPVIKGKPTSTFLGVTLMNPNAIAHPCIEYGILRNWDGVTAFKKPPLFYQSVDDFTARLMEGVSQEILQVKDVILAKYPDQVDLDVVRTFVEFFEESYGDDIQDHATLRTMFNSNKGYDGLTLPCTPTGGAVAVAVAVGGGDDNDGTGDTDGSPGYMPLFEHRYFNEDLPCGILVQKGIAELAGVPTPLMDKVIAWCQERIGKEYLVDGKLMGKDLVTTKTPQRYGYVDLHNFLRRNKYIA